MPEGGIPFGQYVLQRRIARGGMAEVFLAQHRGPDGTDRRVAVKRILPHHADAADFIRMFLGEARLAAELSHPNIVEIYDFGKVDTDYFIAMEYVDGVDVGEVIRCGANDRLAPAMVARIGADAAAALHYAHELRAPGGQPYGLVHRDVSPANLMLSFGGAVKLCDFGIAKAVALGDRPLTRPGLVKGKYAYMSPEQTVGVPLDGRSDVYSLAIVLWELLAGRSLVPRGDAVAAMHAIRQGRLMSIGEAAPWAPPALAEAITWALATDRERRPTAAQLAQALEAFLAASPDGGIAEQLGSWLLARFPREPTDPASSGTDVTHATPSTSSIPFALAALEPAPGAGAHDPAGARPPSAPVRALAPVSIASADTTSRGFDAPRAPGDRSAAPTLIAADPPRFASTEPAADTPMPHALENAETLMRSGAFRAPVPSGPAVVPTLLEARPMAHPAAPMAGVLAGPMAQAMPATALRASPMAGMPVLPAPLGPPRAAMRPAVRVGLVLSSMAALALLSFAIVLGVRGTRRDRAALEAATASGAAAQAASPPSAAPPSAASSPAAPAPAATPATPAAASGQPAPPPVTSSPAAPAAAELLTPARTAPAPATPSPVTPAPAAPSLSGGEPAPPAAVPAAPAAGAMATLDVHTSPAGATVAVRRCRSAGGKCSADRAAVAAAIGDCRAAPCRFRLPAGSYEIAVEADGAREVRTVTLADDEATGLDILLRPPGPPRRAPAGKLTVHPASCRALLDGRTRLAAPISELELRPGAHKLELQCGRRPPVTRSVTIASGRTTTLDLAPR